MREIKFRGKRKDNGKWVRGDLRQVEGRCYIMDYDIGDDGITDTQKVFNIHYGVDPETVGQYTGDKNRGYEGDILEWVEPIRGEHGDIEDWEHCRGVVEWDNDRSGFIVRCANGNEWLEHLMNITVRGNRFDNPDLLREVRE